MLGLGRGLARVEYEHFGIEMASSRDRFDEAAQMIVDGLDKGFVEGSGPYYPQTRTEVRPRPRASFRDRLYAVGISPESVEAVARLGAWQAVTRIGLAAHPGDPDLVVGPGPGDAVEQEAAHGAARHADVGVDRLEAEGKRGKPNVQRFKGLGEMNPLQLRETTMAPETRRLVQLTLDGEKDPAKVIDMLLAKARAGDRREWLMDVGNRAEVEV